MLTNLKKEHLVTGALSPEQPEAMVAIERLERSRLHIVNDSGCTSADVRAYALEIQAGEGPSRRRRF